MRRFGSELGNYAGNNYIGTPIILGGNGPDGPKTTDISLGNWSTSLTLDPAGPLAPYSYTFNTSGGQLAFAMVPAGSAYIGNVLDNVTLNTSATPLPSTWLMLLGGLAGLGFIAYRGTKKTATFSAA